MIKKWMQAKENMTFTPFKPKKIAVKFASLKKST